MVLLKPLEEKLMLGLKVRHEVKQGKTIAILSLPSYMGSTNEILGEEKQRPVHISVCPLLCCVRVVSLPIRS